MSRAGGARRVHEVEWLRECDNDDHEGEQDGDNGVGVTGEIEVEHGGFRPFVRLDGAPEAKV
jgi:hypothetical protein